MAQRPHLSSVALALALGAACAGSTRGSRPRSGQASCHNADVPYSVTYPAAWYAEACARFDPAPLQEYGRDPAIAVKVERSSVDALVRELAGPANDILDRRRVQVAGRPAVRLRMRATHDARLVPPGTLTTQYLVQLPGEVLVASASGLPGTEFATIEDVLDHMIFSLKLE